MNNVIIEDYDGDDSGFRLVLAEYAKKFKKNIFVHDTYDSEGPSPIEDETIHIFPHCSASPETYSDNKRELFDVKLTGEACYMVAPEKTGAIKEMGGLELRDEKNRLFGEAYGLKNLNNLYIHYNILENFDETCEKVLRKILDYYFGIISDKSKLNAILAPLREKNEQILAEARTKYIEAVSKRPENEKKEISKKLQASENEIKKLSLKISAAYREHDELSAKLKQLDEIKEADYKEYGQEFDLLKSHSSVDRGRVYVKGNKIEIFTKRVVIGYKGVDYNIGRFLVSIDINKKRFECRNLDRSPNGAHHPHMGDTDDACFGSASDEIDRYISNYQFAMAFHRIWCRLNIYTNGDQMCDIDDFPVFEPKRKKEAKKI